MAKAEPNVVPLCDVLLVLLIIFMVITPTVQKGIDVKLPETSQEQGATPQGIIVATLLKSGRVDINQMEFEFDQVAEYLKQQYDVRQDKTIFIRADSTLPFQRVMELIDIAKGAGVEVTGIIPELFTEDDM
jgi:biopolymer transport protein TolR